MVIADRKWVLFEQLNKSLVYDSTWEGGGDPLRCVFFTERLEWAWGFRCNRTVTSEMPINGTETGAVWQEKKTIQWRSWAFAGFFCITFDPFSLFINRNWYDRVLYSNMPFFDIYLLSISSCRSNDYACNTSHSCLVFSRVRPLAVSWNELRGAVFRLAERCLLLVVSSLDSCASLLVRCLFCVSS